MNIRFPEKPNLSPTRNIEKEKEAGEKNKIFKDIRERWTRFMLGRKSGDEFEPVDIAALMPDMERFFGQRFIFKGGKWWQTKSVLGDRTLYYPREFALVAKDISPDEHARQLRMLKGGLLHEAGHHIGIVKVLEKFLFEADTQQNIIADLPIGKADIEQMRTAIEKVKSDEASAKDLERLSEAVRIGPYLGNMMFVKDLHNIALDIFLEAYEKQHPDAALRLETRSSLDEVNDALFSDIPRLAGSGAMRASQFRSALVFKKGATARNAAWGGGYDAWFQEGAFDMDVQEALRKIIPAYETLVSMDGFDECIMPHDILKWVKKMKFENGYMPLRSAYLELLQMDIRDRIEQEIKKEERLGGKGGAGGEGGGPNGRGKSGGEENATGESGEGQGTQQQGGGGEQHGGMAGGKPKQGDKNVPKSFDDLDPEAQARILHDILDQMEDERVGHIPVNDDDKKNEEESGKVWRAAAGAEVNKRRAGKGKKSGKGNGGKGGNGGKDGEGETISPLRTALNRAASANRARQWHAESELERARMLGLTHEQLKEYEQRKAAMSGDIHMLSSALSRVLLKKMVPEKKKEQVVGHFMRGRLPEYLHKHSHGEEARTFEYTHAKHIIPEMNIMLLVDHSGSMSENEKNKKAADVALLLMEALIGAEKAVRRQSVGGVKKKEHLLRFGMITFSDTAILQKPLDVPLEERTAAQMYFTAQNISGGGTADAEAFRKTIAYIKEAGKTHKGNRRPFSVVVVISDGAGEREKIKEVLSGAGSLRDKLFIVIGAGTGAESVLESYGKELRGFPIVPIYVPDADLENMRALVIRHALKPLERGVERLS